MSGALDVRSVVGLAVGDHGHAQMIIVGEPVATSAGSTLVVLVEDA